MLKVAGNAALNPRGWLLCLCLGLLLIAAPTVHAGDEQASAKQLEALKHRIKVVDRWLDSAQTHRSHLENRLRDLEKQIGNLDAQLHQLEQKEARQQARLKKLDQQAQTLQQQLKDGRNSLEAQLRSAWMQGDAPAIKVLLNQEDPQRLARTMTYYRYLSQDNVRHLKHFNALLAQLKTTRQQVTETQKQLDQTQGQLKVQRQSLAKKQSQRQVALNQLNAKIQSREQKLKHLKANRDHLQKLLDQVQNAVADIPIPAENKPFASLRHHLPWPLHGDVIGHYDAPMAGGKVRRTGILIKAANNTPVKAVDYGRVVFANWLRGFGLLIIIDHGHGYMSLYGHNSSLLKAPGDWVSAGETIALSGDSGQGDAYALYFEIRHDGRPQNPLHWLGH